VRLTIKAALSDFLKQLNGTYRRSELCDEKHKRVDDNIQSIQRDVAKAEEYTAHRIGQIANRAQVHLAVLELGGEAIGD
jgi:hypothetical protein